MLQAHIIINGNQLSPDQLNDLSLVYNTVPKAGNYWYDQVSGMYGLIGEGTSGFMYPDHGFGKLGENCSHGDTCVFMNGRELPYDEWMVWSQVLSVNIPKGDYWFDVYGNIGVQGVVHPVTNLYLAAKQKSMSTTQSPKTAYSGGDNFWATRFGAGNSIQGNIQGYVSVPGHGPVGYGF